MKLNKRPDENCTFINNTAIYGSAIDWTRINGLLDNCTFINNTAENGSGLYRHGNSNPLFVEPSLKTKF